MKNIKLALIGNPNCGKTSMFNQLTGSLQYVGNWAGVTIEKKEGQVKFKDNITIIDLPGIYSLAPYTLEEVITREYILNEKPDVIINIIDSSNIERNLYLTTQILEMGIPVILALNMMDILEKRGDKINKSALSKCLGCPVLEVSALKGDGLKELIFKAEKMALEEITPKILHKFNKYLEQEFSIINDIIKHKVEENLQRWFITKIFEQDEKVLEKIDLTKEEFEKIKNIIKKCERKFEDTSEAIIINERYLFITSIIKQVLYRNKQKIDTISTKIDNVLTHKYLAFPIFFGIMFFIYYIAIGFGGGIFSDFINDVFFGEYVSNFVISILDILNVDLWLKSLIINGIIGGVGSVLSFIPQISILFLFLSILEDCGYMARVAFIMDKLFRKFGLSGKSFIPFIVSSGCGVPAIMASRTIENENDRKITIMISTFIPCSAKLPLIALFSAIFFKGNLFIAPSIYFLGIFMILLSGVILKNFNFFKGEVSPFVMELPEYHMPTIKNTFLHIWEKVREFIMKAGTIIFISSVIIWFLVNFDFRFNMVKPNYSILASVGRFMAPIFSPLGFGNWQACISILTGLIAKEQIVSMFSVILNDVNNSNQTFINNLNSMFTGVSAYSFIVFNMLCAPCVAAIGAIKREMGSFKWTFFTLAYQTTIAYLSSFIIYQLGSLIFLGEKFNIYTIFSISILIFVNYMLFKPKYNI